MVVFVLDDARRDAFVVFVEIVELQVLVLDADLRLAGHVFPDVRDAQAAFVEYEVFTGFLDDMGVYEYPFESVELGIFFGIWAGVDDEQSDPLVNLRGGKAHAQRFVHGLEHIRYELVQAGMAGLDAPGYLSAV